MAIVGYILCALDFALLCEALGNPEAAFVSPAGVSGEKCDFECAAAGLTAYGTCAAACVAKFGQNASVATCITVGCPAVVAATTEGCLKTCKDLEISHAQGERVVAPVSPVGVSGEKCDFQCAGAGLAAYGTCAAACVAKFGHSASVATCITAGCPAVVAAATEGCLKTCKDSEVSHAKVDKVAALVKPVGVSGKKCDFECAAAGLASYGTCAAACVTKFGQNASVATCITAGCPAVVVATTEGCLKTNPACEDPKGSNAADVPSIMV